MNWLIAFSLRFRLLVVAAAVALIVVRFLTAESIPLDVFPEFAPPRVEIQTEAPGFSTQEVDSLVTVPIENSLGGIPFLDEVRSKSVLGLSSVQLYFQRGADLIIARQLVQEWLALSSARLPRVVNQPVILPPLSSLSRAMKIGLWSDTESQMEMTVLSKWTIRPTLMAIPGVANVAIWGDYDKQFQVLVDPHRLRANNITLNTVMQSVTKTVEPASGGFIDTPNQRLAVRHELTVNTAETLGETIVAFRNNAPLTLGEVADVRIGSPPPIGDAIINDVPGILLIVEKQPWANTLEVTREVEAAMQELAPALTGINVDTTIFRPATFIERALENLAHSLLIGILILLHSGFHSVRTVLLIALTLPFALVGGIAGAFLCGGVISLGSLIGFVTVLGVAARNGIMLMDHYRHLQRDVQMAFGPELVLRGAEERLAPILMTALTTGLVLVPLVITGNKPGQEIE